MTSPQSPVTAREVKLLCPHCSSSLYVGLPWAWTPQVRQTLIKEAIEAHRVNCAGAPPEAKRVYTIEYPRG